MNTLAEAVSVGIGAVAGNLIYYAGHHAWRRLRRPSPEPRPIPAERDDFRENLIRHLYKTALEWAAQDRGPARWVMDAVWLDEVRKADEHGAVASAGSVAYLLGLPLEVREDGGVPHLEPLP